MMDARVFSIAELEKLLIATDGLVFEAKDKVQAYQWVEKTLRGYGYHKLGKRGRGLVMAYIRKMTGYSPAQTKRLVRAWKKTARVKFKAYKRHHFNGVYTRADIVLLASVDEAHEVLAGPATRLILEREYVTYGKPEYERLAGISVSHIYNLRGTYLYHQHVRVFTKTKGTKVTLGLRHKPEPNGKPGYVRVDTVHQGDAANGEKGVYHINFVDEVTQWELVACVETICARDMLPILEMILEQFPFVVIEFHADNGSEYINKLVVDLLNRLKAELSKSRPRRHNDNALVESKNGSVIRKWMGYNYIPGSYAEIINTWYQNWFNTYLNFHRPCGFASTTIDHKGKERKVYKHGDYQLPYPKLQSLARAEQYLKLGITFASLDKIAYAVSDTEFAVAMQKAKYLMLQEIAKQESKETPMEQ